MAVRFLTGDCRALLPMLPTQSVHCCVTSPPYWSLRDYGVAGAIGLEASPDIWADELVAVFREVRRVLRDDGTLWVNLGDTYCAGTDRDRPPTTVPGPHVLAGWTTRRQTQRAPAVGDLKPKDLVGLPWLLAFALRADGWFLRSEIIWAKPNPMPESVTDRPTKAHEQVFLLSKSAVYSYDIDATREPHTALDRAPGNHSRFYVARDPVHDPSHRMRPAREQSFHPLGRNMRSVWTIATEPYAGAHFATFPSALAQPCILAGCPQGGTVLDPFAGSGTVGEVATALGRHALLIELNPAYVALAERRCAQGGLFAQA